MNFRMGLLSSLLLLPTISYAQIDDSEIQFAFSNYLYTNCNEVRLDAQWHDPDFGDEKTNQDELHLYCNDRLLLAYVNSTFELKIKFEAEQAKVISDAPISSLVNLLTSILESPDSLFMDKSKILKEEGGEVESKKNNIFTTLFGNPNSINITYVKKDPSPSQLKIIRSTLASYLSVNCSTVYVEYSFGTNRIQQKNVEINSQEFAGQSMDLPKMSNSQKTTDPSKKSSKRKKQNKGNFESPLITQDPFLNTFPSMNTKQPRFSRYDYVHIRCEGEEVLSKDITFTTKIDFGDNSNSVTKISGYEWRSLTTLLPRRLKQWEFPWEESGFYLVPNETVQISQSKFQPDGSESNLIKYTFVKRIL